MLSERPRSRIVSIIPGMEMGAPERTLTSSGSVASPNRRPTSVSTRAMWTRISSSRPSGQPDARYARQAAVVTTKAGGTGKPSSVAMTEMFAALPPTSCLSSGSGRPCGWS